MLEVRGSSRSDHHYLPPKVSWEEFHDAWDNERRTEWVDGEIIEVSPENVRHQLLTGFLYLLVRDAARRGRPGIVLFTNFLLRLNRRPSGRLPDIVYVANEHLDRLRDTYLDGPADLVVEIISPQSAVRDRRDKLAEYEAEGIPEYWIVDDARREALFYVLDERGKYQLKLADDDGIYRAAVLPDLRIRVSWLWQWPLPDLEDALADLPG